MSVRPSTDAFCAFCSSAAARVYELPTRVARTLPLVRPACYFCFLRMAGIKPTRTRLVGRAGAADAEEGVAG